MEAGWTVARFPVYDRCRAQELLCVTRVPQTSPNAGAGSEFSFPGPCDWGCFAGGARESNDEQLAAVMRKESASPGNRLDILEHHLL